MSAMAIVAFFAATNSEQRDSLMESDVESKAQILIGAKIFTEFLENRNDMSRHAGPLCSMEDALRTKCGTMEFIVTLGTTGNLNSDLVAAIKASVNGKSSSTKASGETGVSFKNNNNKGFDASVGTQKVSYVFTDYIERYCMYMNNEYCTTVYNGKDCMKQYAEAAQLLKTFMK